MAYRTSETLYTKGQNEATEWEVNITNTRTQMVRSCHATKSILDRYLGMGLNRQKTKEKRA